MVDQLLGSIAKLFFGLALVFITLKTINKSRGSPIDSFYTKHKKLLYHLHVNGSKITVILGLAHGIRNLDADLIATISGWLLVATLLGLTFSGGLLSFKHNGSMMLLEDDENWKTIRMFKWVMTILAILLLAFHTLYYQVI